MVFFRYCCSRDGESIRFDRFHTHSSRSVSESKGSISMLPSLSSSSAAVRIPSRCRRLVSCRAADSERLVVGPPQPPFIDVGGLAPG